ncbi:MAG: 23S rRNA (pseudouridine(1915)-N(3))-methyltransferase RlmH [Clostridia bacterium]|nr:23S rRNA (pseudouridine(1915)-N(3))-methyltransferase RlmH [Clostridia bacterium]
MQKITVIAVGSDKEKYFTEAAKEYEKRLSRYAKTEVIVLKDEPIPDDPSEKEMQTVLAKEGQKILAAMPDGCLKVALCVEGKQLSSPELAKMLENAANTYPGVVFIIGGSLGIDQKIKDMCDVRLSFSKLTFPHRLMRVILMEALYRAKTIERGEKYHK